MEDNKVIDRYEVEKSEAIQRLNIRVNDLNNIHLNAHMTTYYTNLYVTWCQTTLDDINQRMAMSAASKTLPDPIITQDAPNLGI